MNWYISKALLLQDPIKPCNASYDARPVVVDHHVNAIRET